MANKDYVHFKFGVKCWTYVFSQFRGNFCAAMIPATTHFSNILRTFQMPISSITIFWWWNSVKHLCHFEWLFRRSNNVNDFYSTVVHIKMFRCRHHLKPKFIFIRTRFFIVIVYCLVLQWLWWAWNQQTLLTPKSMFQNPTGVRKRSLIIMQSNGKCLKRWY